MAIAEAQLAARCNRPGHTLIDHHTYAIASDGDLMEGVAAEAASLAGHLRLGKLTCLYDDNRVTLAAGTDIAFSEDRALRFRAYGWHTVTVADGNDLAAIDAALRAARAETERPSLILVRTHIGFGSPEQDSFKAHGSPLGEDDVRKTKQKLGWPIEPAFLIPEAALARMREAVQRGARDEAAVGGAQGGLRRGVSRAGAELALRLRGELPPRWDADMPSFAADAKGLATRDASGKVMNAIAPRLPALVGGSADLDPSTKTALKGQGDFNPPPAKSADEQGSDGGGWSLAGRNLHFGVREHAMGAIVNGLAAHGGFIAYGATFLIFSDYMRPPLRLAALMGLHVVHVFTHDSLALGEDGPTHQPVEQLANLRAIPHLVVIRPGGRERDRGRLARRHRDARSPGRAGAEPPAAADARARPLRRGRRPAPRRLRAERCAGRQAGADPARQRLRGEPDRGRGGAAARGGRRRALRLDAELGAVRGLPQAERDAVLPPAVGARLAVELGVRQGWDRYIGAAGDMLGVDRFGASAPAADLLREYGFTVDAVCARARALLA